MSTVYHPLLSFMIVGAQKCGTTALARFLDQHPRIQMSSTKEPHLFDAPGYSPDWSPEQIDEHYRPHFSSPGTPTLEKGTPTFSEGGTPTFDRAPSDADAQDETGQIGTPTFESTFESGTPTFKGTPALKGTTADDLVRGEATPIYVFLPEIASELKRYNPDLKLIVLLRDPVERAVSHYYMEKNKGYEQLPLWRALLCESRRLRRCVNPRRRGSAWRRHSYRRRGLYSVQLRNLLRHFDAAQVMLLRAEDLARQHDEALKRAFEFLEVGQHPGIEPQSIFAGERGGRRHPVVSCLLRLSFLPEFVRMRRFKAAGAQE